MNFNIPINPVDVIILIILAIILLFAFRAIIGFFQNPKAQKNVLNPNTILKRGRRVELTIDGMQCGMCEIHIKDAIRKAVPDASNVQANHTKGIALFKLPSNMTVKDLESSLHKTIDPEGYKLLGIQ